MSERPVRLRMEIVDEVREFHATRTMSLSAISFVTDLPLSVVRGILYPKGKYGLRTDTLSQFANVIPIYEPTGRR